MGLEVVFYAVAVFLLLCFIIAIGGEKIEAYVWRQGRTKTAMSNAQTNVRVENRRNGIICSPVEGEPITDNEMKFIIKSIDHPHTQYTLRLTREDFKHDPFETMFTGRIRYWLEPSKFKDVARQMDQDSSSEHPVYTTDETNVMIRELSEKLDIANAKNRNLEATVTTKIDEGIENAALLSKSAKSNEYKR